MIYKPGIFATSKRIMKNSSNCQIKNIISLFSELKKAMKTSDGKKWWKQEMKKSVSIIMYKKFYSNDFYVKTEFIPFFWIVFREKCPTTQFCFGFFQHSSVTLLWYIFSNIDWHTMTALVYILHKYKLRENWMGVETQPWNRSICENFANACKEHPWLNQMKVFMYIHIFQTLIIEKVKV